MFLRWYVCFQLTPVIFACAKFCYIFMITGLIYIKFTFLEIVH